MKKLLFTLTFIITLSCFGQLELRPNPFLKGTIILKDGTIKDGGIRLNGSAFRIRFKDSVKQKKSEKIDYKTVEKIVINFDSINFREFYYKKTTKNKFYSFVELLQSGNIDFYKDLSKNYSPFYEGIDRRTTREWMNDVRSKNPDIPLSENQLQEKNFEKNIIRYLNDCPKFIERAENKEFKARDIPKIITFYNKTCTP